MFSFSAQAKKKPSIFVLEKPPVSTNNAGLAGPGEMTNVAVQRELLELRERDRQRERRVHLWVERGKLRKEAREGRVKELENQVEEQQVSIEELQQKNLSLMKRIAKFKRVKTKHTGNVTH